MRVCGAEATSRCCGDLGDWCAQRFHHQLCAKKVKENGFISFIEFNAAEKL